MEQHLPTVHDLQPGDVIKWYNHVGTPLYGVQVGWPWHARMHVDKHTVFCVRSRGGENFGKHANIAVETIDKIYRFNAINPDEHGSDVAKAHIDELEAQGFIRAVLYTTHVPTIYCKCSVCGNLWDTMETCAPCNAAKGY